MSDFGPGRGNGGLRLDVHKRVNYSLGMVLGEDEFRQDQFHLRERDHLATRGLYGYGTLAGLGVEVDGSQVTVEPGLAVDPAGRLVCVPTAQCSDLDTWLAANQDAVFEGLGSPLPAFPTPLQLFVVLCYRECETDTVPIPIEPCRTGDESMVASRLSESFELRLQLDPPGEVGEVASGKLQNAVDELVRPPAEGSPPGESPPPEGSPPDTGPTFNEIRAGLRAWAVEQRPEVGAQSPCLDVPDDACVLLARLDFEVGDDGGNLVLAGTPTVDDAGRPILMSSRFLQEWLTRLAASGAGGGQPGVAAHHDLEDLDADDHAQYLRTDGTRALTGRLRAGGHPLTGLADAQAPTDAVTLRQLDGVLQGGDAAGGDLTGFYPAPAVAGLREVPVADVAPQEDDSLVFSGGAWRPVPLLRAVLPFATISRLEPRSYQLWFNLDAPRNAVEIPDLSPGQVGVFQETEAGPSFLRRIPVIELGRLFRNVFAVAIQAEPQSGLLRFRFPLTTIRLSTGETVAEYARAARITFEGQVGDEVTKFLLIPRGGL
jgi:hypothetical protein